MTKARNLANFVSEGNPLANGTIDVADINGVTSTAAELNILDGATITTAEINILDGVTATAAEINHLDGVTSPIQTQLNAKAATADIGVTIQGYDVDTAKLDLAQTFTANQTVTAEFKANSYNETFAALSGTTPAVNCETGNVFALTTSGNTTFTFTNPPATGTAYGFTLKITAGGTHTLTWPATVDWAGGAAPDAPASGEVNVYVFYTHDGGTNWYGFLAGGALA